MNIFEHNVKQTSLDQHGESTKETPQTLQFCKQFHKIGLTDVNTNGTKMCMIGDKTLLMACNGPIDS